MTRETASPEETREAPARAVYRPRVDIIDKADAVLLIADLPGVSEEDVDLTVEKETLTLRASMSAATPTADQRSLHSEFSRGEYERSFTLSHEIDRDGIDASVKQGVLRVVLPKSKQSLSRKISVKTG